MLKDFVRGGQTTIHSFRMTMQIFKIIMRGNLVLIFLTFVVAGINFYRTDELQARRLFVFAKMYIMEDFKPADHKYKVLQARGAPRLLTAEAIRRDPQFHISIQTAKETAYTAGYIGGILSIIYSVFFILFFQKRGTMFNKKKHLRGAELVSGPELSFLTKKTLKDKEEAKRAYKLADVYWPRGGETLHTLIVGSTGSGKTVAMSALLDQIQARGDRAIVYDKMGSFVPHFYREDRDVILNPFDVRGAHWDIFAEARRETDFETMAAALIPHHKDTADPFWTTGARQLFASGAAALWKLGNPSLRHLIDMLITADLVDLAEVMKGTVAQAIVDPAQPKTALSVRTVLTTNIRPLAFLADVVTPFSIREWVENEKEGFLFLTSNAATHEARRAMIATQIEIAIVALLSQKRSDSRRLWFIIDELPTLHQIPSLASGLRESRQFGGAIVIGSQVFSELKDIYGREQATTIAGNCNTRLVLNTPDMETAQWLSDSLGRKEEESLQESISYGAAEIRDGVNVARREQLQPLVLPSSLMRLNPLNGFLKMPQEFPVAKVKLKPIEREVIAEAFIEADYIDRLTGEVFEPQEPGDNDTPSKPDNKKQRQPKAPYKNKAKDKKKPATRSVSTPPDDKIPQHDPSRDDDGWSGNSYPSGPATSRISGDPRPESPFPVDERHGVKKKKKKDDNGEQTSLPLDTTALDTPLNGQRQAEFTDENQGDIIMTDSEYDTNEANAESEERAAKTKQDEPEFNEMKPDHEPAKFSSGKKFKSSKDEIAYNMQAPSADQNKVQTANEAPKEGQPPSADQNKVQPPNLNQPDSKNSLRGVYKGI